MAVGKRTDPYQAFRFLVEVEGLVVGGFSEVSGLQVELEVESYREGGRNGYVHALAGPVRYPAHLVLRHGITDADALWRWYRDTLRGAITRRNLSVILQDSAGTEKRRWDFAQAYPVKWNGPDLRANSAEVALETLELAHAGLVE